MAQKNNPSLQIARESLKSAELMFRASYSNYFPKAKVEFKKNWNQDNNYSAEINMSQNLFSGFQDEAKIEFARWELTGSRSQLQKVIAQVSYDLKTAYENLLYFQSFYKLNMDIIKRRQENLRMVELLYTSGGENKGSLLLVKANLALAQWEAKKSQDSIRASQEFLFQVLGEESLKDELFESFSQNEKDPIYLLELENIHVTEGKTITSARNESNNGNSFNNLETHVQNSNKSALDLKKLVSSNPDFKIAAADSEKAFINIQIEKGNFWPTLNFSVTKSRFGDQIWPSNSPDQNYAELSLVFPLFNGGKDYYSYGSAKSLALAALKKKEVARSESFKALETTFVEYQSTREKMKVTQLLLEAQRLRAVIAREKYKNGLTPFEDWDKIENELIAAEKDQIQGYKDQIFAEAAWEKAQGKGVFSEGVE